MKRFVISHYAAAPGERRQWPVPRGTKVISAASREDRPVIYVEQPIPWAPGDAPPEDMVLLEIWAIQTGYAMHLEPEYGFVDTVLDQRHGLVWHLYTRITG